MKLTKSSGSSWSLTVKDVNSEFGGLYFLTARNSSSEEKYPVVIKVKSLVELVEITDCSIDGG